jgi:trehalose/maltose hydrolase-like predicted phosphorylase
VSSRLDLESSRRLVKPVGELIRLPSDPDWMLVEDGVPGSCEQEIEAILAIGNGCLGSRTSLAEDGPLSRPATFAAGIFTHDVPPGMPTITRLPDWSHLEIVVDGERLSFDAGRALEHRRGLDWRRGFEWREWRHEDADGRITRVVFLRLASLAERHLLVQSVHVTAENHARTIDVVARLARSTGRVEFVTAFQPYPSVGDVEWSESGDEARWSWTVAAGESVRLDRVVSVQTVRESAESRSGAPRAADIVRRGNLEAHVQAHVDAWRARWDSADIRIEGDESAQRALRFAIYHLLSAANPTDEHASIGARGLTGLAYRGHAFWDTEIYMLPFYIFVNPPSARALLMYRYHTLDAARRKAAAYGFKGALYAWESADTGDETTPNTVPGPNETVIKILTGELEQHISADVAYAVWQYWRATGDDEFMVKAGAEILIETARFWASRARIESDGKAHVRNVIGPDEYHEPVDDNAYTNGMARWNLYRAAEIVAWLRHMRPDDRSRLSQGLSLRDEELHDWLAIGDALVTGFHPESNRFEQFAGFFNLEEVDVASYRRSGQPIDVALGHDRIQRVQAIKQPDVVALCALLWDEFLPSIHEANFNYYEPRTAHGSSLSPSLSAMVAARLGQGERALDLFREGADIDLAVDEGRAATGVHVGALGGLWQAAVLGFCGVRLRDGGIALDPQLPPGWSAMEFPIRWRGRRLSIRIDAEPLEVAVAVLGGGDLTLSIVGGPACRAHSGARVRTRREDGRWAVWHEDGS